MSASDRCLTAISQEWLYYERYSALVHPIDSNRVHALALIIIPQFFTHMYEARMHLGVNLYRHGRSCALTFLPLNLFSNGASIINALIYLFPPYGQAERAVKSLSLIGGEIEGHVSRPLLAGAVTLILTGLFFGLSVLHHPVREMRRFRTAMPFLLSCLCLVVYGTYIFYTTCRLDVRNQVIENLKKYC